MTHNIYIYILIMGGISYLIPAILHATQSPISGVLALVVGVVAAWCGAGLLPVAVLCCAVVFIAELFL